jgi:hypothetical protein
MHVSCRCFTRPLSIALRASVKNYVLSFAFQADLRSFKTVTGNNKGDCPLYCIPDDKQPRITLHFIRATSAVPPLQKQSDVTIYHGNDSEKNHRFYVIEIQQLIKGDVTL